MYEGMSKLFPNKKVNQPNSCLVKSYDHLTSAAWIILLFLFWCNISANLGTKTYNHRSAMIFASFLFRTDNSSSNSLGTDWNYAWYILFRVLKWIQIYGELKIRIDRPSCPIRKWAMRPRYPDGCDWLRVWYWIIMKNYGIQIQLLSLKECILLFQLNFNQCSCVLKNDGQQYNYDARWGM